MCNRKSLLEIAKYALIPRKNITNQIRTIENKIAVDNIELNYVQSGVGQKSILLMPGALGSAWTDFKPQIQLLPGKLMNHTIIAWDPPGYGKSIPPKRKFELDFFHRDATYAVHLMKVLGKSKFSILGWSDGGITGLILAANYPDQVEKLVIWGSNAYIIDDEIKIYESIRDVNKWSPKMREPMEKIYGVERFAELWSEWIDAIINIHSKNKGNICQEELSNVKAPTLILHGKKDPMIAPEHVSYLLDRISGAEYFEFANGKHNIHLRYPEQFNEIVAKFLQK